MESCTTDRIQRHLDADLRRSLASMGAHLSERNAENTKSMQNPPESKQEPAKVIQLQYGNFRHR